MLHTGALTTSICRRMLRVIGGLKQTPAMPTSTQAWDGGIAVVAAWTPPPWRRYGLGSPSAAWERSRVAGAELFQPDWRCRSFTTPSREDEP